MLHGWKNMHPAQHYIQNHVSTSTSISTTRPISPRRRPSRVGTRTRSICPGAGIFRRSDSSSWRTGWRRAPFVGLGRTLSLRAITCPTYLLAGAADDITTPEQVLDAAKYIGTPKDRVVRKTVPGGHIGLFMGARTLKENWPPIAQWIAAQ